MANTDYVQLNKTTRYGLLVIAVVQGYALYFLHLALTEEVWPATDMRWLKAFYTVAIGLPAFFYLGMERLKDPRNLPTAAILTLVLFLLGWHLGWIENAQGLAGRDRHEFTPPFILSMGVVLFILAFFYRSWAVTGRLRFGYDFNCDFNYERLLAFSWQQALTLGLLGLFVGIFWLLLVLCAGLFDAIGIDFFKELFQEPAFFYPVTALVLGLGLVLVRNRIRLVATVQFMCEALIKALLPLAALIVVLFLATLPFTGLQPVWDTGSAAAMMMALTLILLFFFNAVLSGSPEQPPYPLPLRLFVLMAVALLPVTTLVAAWALWLRIDQYGLTTERLWAGVILLLTAGYTFSYTVLILWKRTEAVLPIQTANKWLALTIAGVLVLVNTPIADLRDWSAQSQASRLLNGEVEVDDFDYAYMRFSLGAYGVQALREIEQSEFARNRPEVAKRIAATMKQKNRWSNAPIVDKNDLAAVAELFDIIPADKTIPDQLLKLVTEHEPSCLDSTDFCQAVNVANSSAAADWLILRRARNECLYGSAYTLHGDQWLKMGSLSPIDCCGDDTGDMSAEKLEPIAGPFLAYAAGECVLSVSPDKDYLLRILEREAGQVGDEALELMPRH